MTTWKRKTWVPRKGRGSGIIFKWESFPMNGCRLEGEWRFVGCLFKFAFLRFGMNPRRIRFSWFRFLFKKLTMSEMSVHEGVGIFRESRYSKGNVHQIGLPYGEGENKQRQGGEEGRMKERKTSCQVSWRKNRNEFCLSFLNWPDSLDGLWSAPKSVELRWREYGLPPSFLSKDLESCLESSESNSLGWGWRPEKKESGYKEWKGWDRIKNFELRESV